MKPSIRFLKIGHVIDDLWNRKSLLGVAKSEVFVREHLPVRFVQGEKQRSLSLHFSSCCYGPDGFKLASAIGIVVVVQVDRRIDMTGDKLYAIAHFKLNAG